MSRKALVFGGSGAIGSAVADHLRADGCEVWTTSRSLDGDHRVIVDVRDPVGTLALRGLGPFEALVWAQGVNTNDSISDMDGTALREVVEVNTFAVVDALHALLSRGQITHGARVCIVSSIWQRVTRRNKLSYTVSKAALDGVVRSVAADLAPLGILVNSVLPGVVDTPMTRGVLSPEQIANVERANGFGRLVTVGDVASTVAFLCSERNTAITGQSIAVDLGFGHERDL